MIRIKLDHPQDRLAPSRLPMDLRPFVGNTALGIELDRISENLRRALKARHILEDATKPCVGEHALRVDLSRLSETLRRAFKIQHILECAQDNLPVKPLISA